MSSETPQPERPPPSSWGGRLISVVKGLPGRITGLAALAAAIIYLVTLGLNFLEGASSTKPEAEYNRLSMLKAGITLSQFEDILEEDKADIERSAPDGLKRHIYLRPYDYVLAVTDEQTVISFSVMVRAGQEDFHPNFDGIVLGQTTLDSAWETPGALAGVCGQTVAYFERSVGPSTAEPRVRAVGVNRLGQVDDTDIDLLCDANEELYRCDGDLTGDADLAVDAVDCFLGTDEGRLLRETVRPNIYSEGASNQELSYDLITPFDPEIADAEG